MVRVKWMLIDLLRSLKAPHIDLSMLDILLILRIKCLIIFLMHFYLRTWRDLFDENYAHYQ